MRQRKSDVVSIKIEPSIRLCIEKIAHKKEIGMSELVRGYLHEGLQRDRMRGENAA